MRHLYFVPASETGLNDSMFGGRSPYRGGVSNMDFWRRFAEACRGRGIAARTLDFWSEETAGPDDALLVQNHPGETLLWRTFYFLKHGRSGFLFRKRKFIFGNRRFFRRRALWQGESPMVVPYIYHRLPALHRSGLYHKIFLLSRGGRDDAYFNYFYYRGDDFVHPAFDAPKKKFLAMVNTNALPHSLANELYGERLRAIRYFSPVPGFDLYGYGWDAMPRHPFYFSYGRYVKKVFRGEVDDKVGKLSEYRFALCFENCSYPGYVSEKIFDCLAAGCVPIYLGAPDITDIVPAECFIDFRKFNGDYAALHRFLDSRTETDMQNYRAAIKRFLQDASTRKSIGSFIDEIVAA